jgi:hypothetical protein
MCHSFFCKLVNRRFTKPTSAFRFGRPFVISVSEWEKASNGLEAMKAVKQIGKGIGATALAGAGALFAEYTLYHFPGWPFALSLLLSACTSMPMVNLFNLFPSVGGAELRIDGIKKQNADWDV